MITVNGEQVQTDSKYLGELLSEMDLAGQLCAIEINKKLVPHKERDDYTLQDGDAVEIVTLVGGG